MPAVIIICVLIFLIVFFFTSFVKIELEYDLDFFVKVKYLCFTVFMMPKSKRMLKRERKKEEKERKKKEKLLKKRERLRKKTEKGQHLKEKRKEKGLKASNDGGGKTAIPEKCSGKEQNVKIKESVQKAQNLSDGKKKTPDSFHEQDKPKPSPETIIGCIKAAKPHIKRLFKKIRFYDIFSEIVVGGDDAAKTAISYGVHCSAVYGLVCFLKNTVSFKEKKIDIKANFDLEKTDYYFYGKVKVRLSTLLRCVIWGFFAVRKAMTENPSQKGSGKSSKGTARKAA